MIHISREELLKAISAKVLDVDMAMLKKRDFSDNTLEVLAYQTPAFIRNTTHSKFRTENIDRLFLAYNYDDVIGLSQLKKLMMYSLFTRTNEIDLDRYLDNVYSGYDPVIATDAFILSTPDKIPYIEVMDLIESGIYEIKDSKLSLMPELAKEIGSLGIELLSSRDGRYKVLLNVDEAALNDDRIVFDDYRLARSISELSKTPDWEDAKEFVKDYLGDGVQQIDCYNIEHYYYMYQVDLRLACLRRLVNENYESFINEVRHGTIDETINRAEEIVTKGNIKDFINDEIPGISVENYGALITICDPLDEIYTEWGKRRDLHAYSDIEKAIESAAEKVCLRLKREKTAREQKPSESAPFTDKPNYKPKKTRR
ncbi:MAG: DUF3848 domain-containing protein [Ruminococcus sp.]|nr:DUF3848 domain-containing protein [Ruminococcus sp.]